MLLPKSKHHSSFLKVILCRSKEFSQSADGELRTMKVDLLQSLHFTDRKTLWKSSHLTKCGLSSPAGYYQLHEQQPSHQQTPRNPEARRPSQPVWIPHRQRRLQNQRNERGGGTFFILTMSINIKSIMFFKIMTLPEDMLIFIPHIAPM